MWARVKGRTENALLRLPFKRAYMFRPGFILPLDGIRSSTRWYNLVYAIGRPLYPLIHRLSPDSVTTTRVLGRAMIAAARSGFERPVVEMSDINRLGNA